VSTRRPSSGYRSDRGIQRKCWTSRRRESERYPNGALLDPNLGRPALDETVSPWPIGTLGNRLRSGWATIEGLIRGRQASRVRPAGDGASEGAEAEGSARRGRGTRGSFDSASQVHEARMPRCCRWGTAFCRRVLDAASRLLVIAHSVERTPIRGVREVRDHRSASALGPSALRRLSPREAGAGRGRGRSNLRISGSWRPGAVGSGAAAVAPELCRRIRPHAIGVHPDGRGILQDTGTHRHSGNHKAVHAVSTLSPEGGRTRRGHKGLVRAGRASWTRWGMSESPWQSAKRDRFEQNVASAREVGRRSSRNVPEKRGAGPSNAE